MAEVSQAFPGLFTFREMAEMDFRVFRWWVRQASDRRKEDLVVQGQMVRAATHMKQEDFNGYVQSILDRTSWGAEAKERRIGDTWEHLQQTKTFTAGRGVG